jgi:flagellin
MALGYTSNITAMQAAQHMAQHQRQQLVSTTRLSSGLRINSASDDAASMAISERMNHRVSGLEKAIISAESYLGRMERLESNAAQIQGVIGRMRDLAAQALNGDLTSTDRGYLNTEYSTLNTEWQRLRDVDQSDVATRSFMHAPNFRFHLGDEVPTSTSDVVLSMTSVNLSPSSLGVGGSTVDTTSNAQTALTSIDTITGSISMVRTVYGTGANRFRAAVDQMRTHRTSLQGSLSHIRDADIAEETSQLARSEILIRGAASVISQSGLIAKLALSLLG